MSENNFNADNENPSPHITPPPPPYEQTTASTQAFPPPPPEQPVSSYDTADGSLMAPTKDERMWAMFAHFSGLAVGLLASGVGLTFLGFLGPLIIYLVKRDESAFIADQAKEALNFYITCSLAALALIILSLTVILLIITIPAMILLGIGALILTIIAGIKANEGELYRYPFTLRLIK